MSDPDPRTIASSRSDRTLVVVAPPGCGKTEFLALRTDSQIQHLQAHQRVLALTFTNRAKANLTERLRRILGQHRFRRYVKVRNFHGHAAEVVLAHGRTIGINPDGIKLPTTKTLQQALRRFSTDRDARANAEKLLGHVKRSPLSDEEVLTALESARCQLALDVESERIASNQLHYDDLLRHAQRILMVDEVANLYQRHYGALLVDEFQDLSLQQLDVALRTCTDSRTFVGDPLQGIYSWAGASPREVEQLLRSHCSDPVHLSVSHRSSPAVLQVFNAFSEGLGSPPLQAYDAARWPGGGAAAALVCQSQGEEAALVRNICEMVLQKNSDATVGVITRSGWRRQEIDRHLATSTPFPCRRWDLALSDPLIADRIRQAVHGTRRELTFDDVLMKAVASVDRGDVDTIEQITDAINQLKDGGHDDVRVALSQLRDADTDSPIGPGVHLLNAHTGKGQQFDWVIIPGLEERHLPDSRSTVGEALAEEQRVLLVMLSRARHGIVILRADTLTGRFGPYASTPSRWWRPLADACSMDYTSLRAHIRDTACLGMAD